MKTSMGKAGELRPIRIFVRVTQQERDAMARNASKCRLTLSEYVRRSAIGLPVASRVDAEALGELRRQGGLIKHLAANDRQHAYEYRVTLNLIQETVRQLQYAGQSTDKTA